MKYCPTMRLLVGSLLLTAVIAIAATSGRGQTQPAAIDRPSVDSVRAQMAIPSHGLIRGRIESSGYARNAEQMEKAWELSALPPGPDSLGPAPASTVVAVISPHDDFSFAGRVYRRVLPRVTAQTVILIGVFHRYWAFGEHDRLVFDTYKEWMAPDDNVPVSTFRDALMARLPPADFVQDSVAHDAEHSLEPLVCWLRHANPDLQIVPIIVPGAHFDRLEQLADHLAAAISTELKARSWELGRDVAIAISADAIHYGPDFKQESFGPGGLGAYQKAMAKDRGLLNGMRGLLTTAKIRTMYGTFVDPNDPDTYRWTWCGRFSVPFGLLTLERLARGSGGAMGYPLAYGTSIGSPQLDLRDVGMAPTAPTNLYHFVGYPGVAFTMAAKSR